MVITFTSNLPEDARRSKYILGIRHVCVIIGVLLLLSQMLNIHAELFGAQFTLTFSCL